MSSLLPLAAWLSLRALGPAPAQPVVQQAAAPPASRVDVWTQASPGCGDAKYCFGIALHVVEREGRLAQTPEWLGVQLSEANRHFAAIHTAFEIRSVDSLAAEFAHIATREQRDAIGRKTVSKGVVHVFLVERLDDVDAVGEQIRGLHWRQRSKIEKRWVILSAIAPDMVLAHELGHFFSLPHSRFPISIMNKRPRKLPPRDTRTFHAEEVVQMRSARNVMVREGMLMKSRRE